MKKFSFSTNRGSEITYRVIPEDQLEEKHITLLLGELVKKFNDSPKIVRERFMKHILESIPVK
jgi:hypothetical protein